MCGICGVYRLDGQPADSQQVEHMTGMIVHRGPDQGRVLADGPCVLGNRRLAILDLSPAGALPMRTRDGRLTIAYNGEVYNYPELRPLLESSGVQLNSHSDTEALLELYRREGAAMLHRLRGMFAFALWDSQQQTLLLARDRMGKKPLYYYHDAHILVFASEIKALLAHPLVPRESALDASRLARYLGYGYIPAPDTAFKGIYALLPGHAMHVRGSTITIEPYWTLPQPEAASGTLAEHIESLRAELDTAVRLRLLSDVPLGAFLSGGLDSSLIVALMRRHSSGSVKTFSIGFEGDSSFDETVYARQVARHLQTDHTAFTVQADALDLLPKLVWHHDQPFADSSAIPTYLVSKLTREHVTVALTGDGGDELFAGYERFYAAALVRRLGFIPRSAWKFAAQAAALLPEGTAYYSPIKRAGRFARGASLSPALAYFDFVRLFDAGWVRDLAGTDDLAGADFAAHWPAQSLDELLMANMQTYLPDDLLIKTDRCSMAASLEARSPFLDHVLVEQAARIPAHLKLNGRTTKFILKEAARGLLPDHIIDRKKHGFGVPLGTWLRNDMSLVREMLLSREAAQRGILNQQAVERLIAEHSGGVRDHGQRLWTLLTLESWFRQFIDPTSLVAQ